MLSWQKFPCSNCQLRDISGPMWGSVFLQKSAQRKVLIKSMYVHNVCVWTWEKWRRGRGLYEIHPTPRAGFLTQVDQKSGGDREVFGWEKERLWEIKRRTFRNDTIFHKKDHPLWLWYYLLYMKARVVYMLTWRESFLFSEREIIYLCWRE